MNWMNEWLKYFNWLHLMQQVIIISIKNWKWMRPPTLCTYTSSACTYDTWLQAKQRKFNMYIIFSFRRSIQKCKRNSLGYRISPLFESISRLNEIFFFFWLCGAWCVWCTIEMAKMLRVCFLSSLLFRHLFLSWLC